MKKYLPVILLIVFGVMVRLTPHAPNLAPLSALALFAGYTLTRRQAIAAIITVAIFTDSLIGFYELPIMIAVYSSYVIMALLGWRYGAGKSAQRMMLLTWANSLTFFFVTNGAVWAFSPWYEKTPVGLISSYMNGLPFLRNSLIGDMGYGFLFFAGYSLYRARAPVYKMIRRQLRAGIHLITHNSSHYVDHH